MQRVCGNAWLLVVARRAVQRASAPEIHRDIDQRTTNGIAEMVGGGRAVAQTAVGFDQNAARQDIQQRR